MNFLNIHEPSFFNSIAIIYHLRRRVFFIMLDVYKKKRWVTIPASGDGMLFRVDKAKKGAVPSTAPFLAIIPQKQRRFAQGNL